ncbi:hypothetical protein CLIB1444_02S16622 [[Candida] jaroonii]|uniref:Uncharacterized protein n=1 Tax=[Candida] jaroonii TaxID=467808 RepID=A0ACA9Y5Y5_9ASCO|nr:hypothetical protein CLIB1444_02S16622 [[Candida] jaroonii]
MVIKVLNIIYNPLVVSFSLVCLTTYLQSTQISELLRSNLQITYLDINAYLKDILSNIINIIFLVRFTGGLRRSMVIEIPFLMIQSIIVGYLFYNFKFGFNYESSLFILQIVCPALINIINFQDFLSKIIGFKELLANLNNNCLPILLTNSFCLINLDFKLLNFNLHQDGSEYLLLAYQILLISLKFYCLFQYIWVEVLNIFEYAQEEKLNLNHNNYLILACTLMMIFDMMYVFIILNFR